ncbi:MAG: Fic/DOC family protein [Succinivibrionaceae bacterium]
MDNSFYEYEHDNFYCYKNSNVLKNLFNIQDPDKLQQAEREISSLRIAELMKTPLIGNFDLKHLKDIHKAIFGDIYSWAGNLRTVNISKGNQFCISTFIEQEINKIFLKLKNENFLNNLSKNDLAIRLAFYLGEINAIHPFREGNGRTQRLFIYYLALHNGYELNFAKISKKDMIEASKQTFNMEYKLMEKIMAQSLISCNL